MSPLLGGNFVLVINTLVTGIDPPLAWEAGPCAGGLISERAQASQRVGEGLPL